MLNGTVLLGQPADVFTYGYLSFSGSQTLSGSGVVVFGRGGCNAVRVSTGGTTLTIGSNITVRGQSGQIGFAPSCIGGPQNVAVSNQGAILADVAGGTITIRAQPFSNSGTTNQLNGGILIISP